MTDNNTMLEDAMDLAPQGIPPRRSRHRGKEDKPAEQQKSGAATADHLPARRASHPSERDRVAKWFINLLFVLLLGLMAGLMYWGYYKFSGA